MNDRGPVNIQGVSCDTVHDIESVMFVRADVSGKPADPATWTDEHWAKLDAMCREFGAAVIGATRDDLTVNADILPQTTKRAGGHGVRQLPRLPVGEDRRVRRRPSGRRRGQVEDPLTPT